MAGRSRLVLVYGSLALGTILAGLLLRLAPVGLPFSVVKWGGSVLWAAMLYFVLAALLSSRGPLTVAFTAEGIAVLVELVRLLHWPSLDAFRFTLAGQLLLGRVFSWVHFLVYGVAIGLAALADRRWMRSAQAGMG